MTDTKPYEDALLDLLPFGNRTVRMRTALDLSDTDFDFSASRTPLDELFEIWVRESGRNEFYHGIYRAGAGELCGLAYIGVSVGITEEISHQCSDNTIAHEIGHNLTLRHAPACGAEDQSPDPDFPHADGSIGTENGWLMRRTLGVGQEAINTVKYYDTMSYCLETFTSRYSYGKAFDFWQRQRTTPIVVASKKPSPPQAWDIEIVEGRSWAITGKRLNDGTWVLLSKTIVDRRAHEFHPYASAHTLIVEHVPTGRVLHREQINLAKVGHGPDVGRVWGVRVPFYASDELQVSVIDADRNVLFTTELN